MTQAPANSAGRRSRIKIMSNIAAVLFRRKRPILAVFLIVFSVSTAFTLLSPKRYEARMKILVKHERPDPVVSPDKENAVIRGEVSEADVNSEIELLASRQILREVVLLNKLAAPSESDSGAATERAVRQLAKDLVITPVRKASIIQVSYTSTDAARTATVLKTLADLYLETHLRVHRSAGAQEFFKSQALQHEARLSNAQERLAVFRRTTGVVLLQEQKDITLRRIMETEAALTEVNAALDEAVSRAGSLRSQLASLQPRVVTQSRVVPNQYSVERLHTMLADLQNRRTDLLSKFHSEDRLVREIEQQIAGTKAALDRAQTLTAVEETTDVNPLRQAMESELVRAELSQAGAGARKKSLTAALAAWRSRMTNLDSATAEYDSLTRAVREAGDNLNLYSKKQEEARIADSLDQQKFANVSIAEAPVQPHLPSKPNIPLNLALGFALACFVSLGLAFVLEINRSSFDTGAELALATRLPVLAVVSREGA